MGGKKKTEQKQTNTYAYMPPPVTPEIEQAKSVAKDLRGEVNPLIRASYADAREELDDSFLNPMGAFTTPAIREATLRAGRENLRQNEQTALAGAEFAVNNQDFANQMAIAGMTQPQLIQTGGTATQTQSGGNGFLNGLVAAGANVGSAALM